MTPPETPSPPRKPLPVKRLALITGAAVVAATLIVFGAILPAEFGRDPLGIGRLTGISRLHAPEEVAFKPENATQVLARDYATPFRTDVVEIPLDGDDGAFPFSNELEYKVSMKKGATLVYQWSIEQSSDEANVYFDFHGHTPDESDKMTVATYKQAEGRGANGALDAPFDGIHGWYWQNHSAKPVVVRVRLAGFYDLVEPGAPGNESGIHANVPAAEAFGPLPE